MSTPELDGLLKQLDSLVGASKDERLVKNFSGALLYGKFASKKKARQGVKKAKELIKERCHQEPRAEHFFKAIPFQTALYLDQITNEWLVIYLGEYLADN